MSLSISLYENNSEIASMNWLRNPFGLERWAEANTEYATRECNISFKLPVTLWDVCNKWSYDDSEKIDRTLFKVVVDTYSSVIQQLEHGYFWFDLHSVMQFIAPKYSSFPKDLDWNRIKGSKYHNDTLGVPQEYFGDICGGDGNCNLDYYKNWFGELVEFADELQHKEYTFYCSN